MARILITGASGFLGRRLVAHLGPRHELFCLGRSAPPGGAGEVHWVAHDLARPLAEAALPARVDAVVCLAQSRRYREFPAGAADMFAVNLRATFELLEYARGAGAARFFLASTGGVYAPGPEPLDEDAPVSPPTFYARSKYAAELLAAAYQPHLHVVAARFFFIYGPGQRGMLVPNLLGRVLRGEPVTVEGRPGMRVNPIYVDDAVAAVEAALALEGSAVLNVAGDEVVSLTGLVRLMEGATGRPAHIGYGEARGGGDLVGDNRRMKALLGVAPRTPLAEGLRLTLAEGL